MKKIKLTRGKFALVDDEDYEYLNQWRWYCNAYGYAVRSINYRKSTGIRAARQVWMHREIMQTPEGFETDHIDGNKSNNQKSNLRICTKSDNQHNTKKRKDNISGFKGVYWLKSRSRWTAQIANGKQQRGLGVYKNKKEAAKAYNKAAILQWGVYAKVNQI